jgi:dethiobiotin synthetase
VTRPSRLIAVVGTNTEVGKTWVSAQLLARLKSRGVRVAARKPLQSFEAGAGPTDAEVLAAATGENAQVVCPDRRSYPLPLAPPMAAEELGRPRILLEDVLADIQWPDAIEVGLVETVGGAFSPLAHDGHCVDCVRLLGPDHVLLVADAGLGTINSTRLTMQAIGSWRCHVFLNRYDDDDLLHRRNAAWLRRHDRLDVVVSIDELERRLSC